MNKIENTIAGYTGSGKTVIAHKIAAALRECCAKVDVFDDNEPVSKDSHYDKLTAKLDTNVKIFVVESAE